MAIVIRPGGKPPIDEEDLYPSSDGEPMGETDIHAEQTRYCITALQLYYADQPNVYVSGDNFIYFQEGDPKKMVSPDCYVVFGIEKKLRNSYMTWKEDGKLPSVVIEITSKKTKKEDTRTKRALYEQVLKVPEYFLFDPTADYLKPPLQGYRLVNGHYEPLLLVDDRLHSEQLGLDLVIVGEDMRLFDPVRERYLPTVAELAKQAEEAAGYARTEAYRAFQQAQRAEREARRAEQEAQARLEAVRRAEESEAENARLRAELEALRRQ